jgi:hypothetical protein
LIHQISDLPLIKDRLTNLGKKYIGYAEGRSELMELLVSDYKRAKSTIQKDEKLTPLCLFLSDD